MAAILVVAVVGYISYTALSGLPFQPIYRVNIELPNAEHLIATDDVRIGGVRVGEVSSVAAEPSRGPRPLYARVALALSPSVGRLPVDTTVEVRPVSVLGATYVQLALGHSRRTIPAGGTLPLSQATSTIDLTDLFGIFSRNAAQSFQSATADLAYGLAGRGQALNTTIAVASRLLTPLTEVERALAAPAARLAGFLSGFASAANAFAPVSVSLAELMSGAAQTFDAFARSRIDLASAIDLAPPTESATTIAFQRMRPALDGLAQLSVALGPTARLLPSSLSVADEMLSAGVRPLDDFPPLAGHLRGTFSELASVSRLPSTGGALRKLRDIMSAATQMLTYLVPAQVHCNIIGLLTQNFASAVGSIGFGQGPSLAVFTVATTGAATDSIQSAAPAPDLHDNYLPEEDAHECASNNEPAANGKQALGNPPGNLPDSTRTTYPPPGVTSEARAAGLYDNGAGQ